MLTLGRLGNPGNSPHLTVLNLILFAKSFLLCKVVVTGSGDEDVDPFAGQGGGAHSSIYHTPRVCFNLDQGGLANVGDNHNTKTSFTERLCQVV